MPGDPDELSKKQMAGRVYDDQLDPAKAWQSFYDLVNVGRRSGAMFRDPDSPVIFDPRIKTKNALVQVLTTGKGIMTKEVDRLLRQHGLVRHRSTIRTGLRRLVAFGFATASKANKDRYNRKEWRLTQRGATYALQSGIGNTVLPKPTPSTPTNTTRSKTMCIDPNRPTFNAAVETAVGGLISAKKVFSAYDVTKLVREMTGQDPTLIKDAGQAECYVGGQQVANITHEDVKNVVHDLFHQGKMAGYDRTHDGKFWVYVEAVVPADQTPIPDPGTSTPPAADGSSYDGNPAL